MGMGDKASPEAEANEELAAPGEERGEAAGEGPTEEDLKQAWLSHCSAVRLLERDGKAVPVELLAAAKEQREAAERKWRAAKRPHPLHKRLRWAEA